MPTALLALALAASVVGLPNDAALRGDVDAAGSDRGRALDQPAGSDSSKHPRNVEHAGAGAGKLGGYAIADHSPLSLPTLAPRSPPLHARAPGNDSRPLADVVFNYTITDMSPILIYTPSASGPIAQSWQNSFSGSQAAPAGQSVFGEGTSAHTSSAANAYLTMQFVGTGVFFFGSTSNPTDPSAAPTAASVRLTVDGINIDFQPAGMPDGLLGFKNQLPYGPHSAVLSVLGGTVSLRNVSIETQMQSQAPDFSSAKATQHLLYDGKSTNADFATSGDWFPVGTIGGGDNTASHPFPVLNGRPSATFSYTVPANTSFMTLNGVTQPTNAYYTVSMSPEPPGGIEFPLALNAFQGFTNPTDLFFTPLDPAQQYNLTFSVRADATGIVGVHSVTTYSSAWTNDTAAGNSTTTTAGPTRSPTSPVPSTSGTDPTGGAVQLAKSNSIVGPVVGGVVGGVGGLLILAALFWFFCIRRKAKPVEKARQVPDENFVIDDDMHEQTTPYPYEMAQRAPDRVVNPQTTPHRVSYLSNSSSPLTDPSPGTVPPAPQGYTPSPASPTLTASTSISTNLLGLGVVNGDTDTPPNGSPTRLSVAAQKRAAAQRASVDRVHPPQERDAGRWNADADDAVAAMKSVPPSYDPSWAGDFGSAISTPDDLLGASIGPSAARTPDEIEELGAEENAGSKERLSPSTPPPK